LAGLRLAICLAAGALAAASGALALVSGVFAACRSPRSEPSSSAEPWPVAKDRWGARAVTGHAALAFGVALGGRSAWARRRPRSASAVALDRPRRPRPGLKRPDGTPSIEHRLAHQAASCYGFAIAPIATYDAARGRGDDERAESPAER